MLSWLCYGDIGIDEYHKGERFIGGISYNHLVHLRHFGHKSLYFLGPLSNQYNDIIDALDKLHINRDYAQHIDGPPPIQKIRISPNGEKEFYDYQQGILDKYKYQYLDKSFDYILLPLFKQNIKMIQDFFLMPIEGKKIIDLLNLEDFDFNFKNCLTSFPFLKNTANMIVVGCPENKNKLYNELKEEAVKQKINMLVTRGKNEGFYFDGSLTYFEPDSIENVIDSTGAGDAFLIAFLHYSISLPKNIALNKASLYSKELLSKLGPN